MTHSTEVAKDLAVLAMQALAAKIADEIDGAPDASNIAALRQKRNEVVALLQTMDAPAVAEVDPATAIVVDTPILSTQLAYRALQNLHVAVADVVLVDSEWSLSIELIRKVMASFEADPAAYAEDLFGFACALSPDQKVLMLHELSWLADEVEIVDTRFLSTITKAPTYGKFLDVVIVIGLMARVLSLM